MNRFHQIIACLFAILVANPVLCCGAHLTSGDSSCCHSSVQKSCCQTECGNTEKSPPADHSCGCNAQSPRESESTPASLVAPSFDRLPPQYPESILLAHRLAMTADLAVSEAFIDPGPSGLRLAMLQRFRI